MASDSAHYTKHDPIPARLVQLGLMLLAAFAAARLIWAIFVPVSPLGPIPPADILVRQAPQFVGLNSLFGFASDGGDVVVSTAGMELFGIRMDRASGRGSAILGNESVAQQSFAIGEEVIPGLVLAEVRFDHVILTNRGVREALYLDQSAPAKPVGTIDSNKDGGDD